MKKINRTWSGRFGKLMVEHLELRRSLGADYRANEITLHGFQRYLNRHYPTAPAITRRMVKKFMDTKSELSPWGRRNVVIYIRQFCRFLNQRDMSCYIPDKTLLPKLTYRIRYFPLKKRDVKALMEAARGSLRVPPFLRDGYATMIGLAWCAGLRRNEVIKLNHGDVDLERRTLFIRETKFRKSRLLPIKNSTASALSQYIEAKRSAGHSISPRDALFINRLGKRMPLGAFAHTFRRLIRLTEIKAPPSATHQKPRLHDLRHAFATSNLKRFYNKSEGLNPQSYLPVLATYLGHCNLVYSQYYLHPDFSLLMKASKKLEASSRRITGK